MINTNFKALMYCGMYVHANQLVKGIYESNKPFIYTQDETIETMIDKAKAVKDILNDACWFGDLYFENLKQCQLVPIEIKLL